MQELWAGVPQHQINGATWEFCLEIQFSHWYTLEGMPRQQKRTKMNRLWNTIESIGIIWRIFLDNMSLLVLETEPGNRFFFSPCCLLSCSSVLTCLLGVFHFNSGANSILRNQQVRVYDHRDAGVDGESGGPTRWLMVNVVLQFHSACDKNGRVRARAGPKWYVFVVMWCWNYDPSSHFTQ